MNNQPSSRFQSRPTSSGFTLVNLLLVLAVISVLSAAIFGTYKLVNHSAQDHTAVQSIRTLSRTVAQTYGQSGTYTGVTSAKLIQNDLAPQNLIRHGQLINSWGGQITVAPQAGTNNEAYQISLAGIPTSACISLTSQLKKEFSSIDINGSQVASAGFWPDIGTLTNVCAASNSNTIALNSYPLGSTTTGEVALGPNAGNAPPAPVLAPPTNGVTAVAGVTPVAPTAIAAPVYASFAPPMSHSPAPGLAPVSVSAPPGGGGSAIPPNTPGASCVPGSTSSSTDSTQTGTQTLTCLQAGYPSTYTGSVNQSRTRTQTITNTDNTTCATPWSAPVTTTSSNTTYSAWSAWATVPGGDTCIPPTLVASDASTTATCVMTGDYGSTQPAVNGTTSCRQMGAFHYYNWWGGVFSVPLVSSDPTHYSVTWAGCASVSGAYGEICSTPQFFGNGLTAMGSMSASAYVVFKPTGQIQTITFTARMMICGYSMGYGPVCN